MLSENAPFSPSQRQAIQGLVAQLDLLQRGWLSGFLAASGSATAAAPSTTSGDSKVTLLYGTESGNAETLAARAVKDLKKAGHQAVMKNMSEISVEDLSKWSNLLIIVSTWGDGEPPETAVAFHKAFMASTAKLDKLSFSVCALGDTSYEKFCQTGKDFDQKLADLGAQRLLDRQDCDVDFEESYSNWIKACVAKLSVGEASAEVTTTFNAFAPTEEFGKKNPFPAEVLELAQLNGEGTKKETLHLALSLEGSGMSYEVGDALAVQPFNAPDVVQALLGAAKLSGNEMVEIKGDMPQALSKALRDSLDITAVSKAVLTKLQAAIASPELEKLLAEDAKEALKSWLWGKQIVDAIESFAPNGLSADQLVSICRKLPVRLYSIASSPLAHPGEVHLTVAAVRYQSNGRERKGVCSTYIADLLKEGDKARVFVQPNKNFRLPENPQTPIIMVGPGTGIAPFRAFVEHRGEQENRGKSWLFFGDQHYLYDFLYQLEWQDHLKSGALTKLDVAFSRDQPEKIYVQDKLRQRGAEVYAWLQEGAHFYVCGDASRMAADVHEALLSILETHGKLSRVEAEAFLEDLKKAKRYQRDVY